MSSDHEELPFDLAGPDSDDDEDDWEDALVPEQRKPIQITIGHSKDKNKQQDTVKQKKGISHAGRLLRIDCHKAHTVALLANAKVRNEWINDELLHARLLSLTPLTLQNEFALIHKTRIPDQGQRGRAFERAMQHLAEWWSHSFFEVLPEGHIRNRTFDEVQAKLELFGVLDGDPEEPVDPETMEDILGEEGETIKGPKSLMKHALMHAGSRDLSSQLFTALCRALGIPTRLVVSLQSVPWKTSVGKPKPKYTRKKRQDRDEDLVMSEASASTSKGKALEFQGDGEQLDGAPVQKSEKAKGKQKAQPIIKLRKQKDKGRKLGDPSPSAGSSRLASPDPTTTPPVFWTEVFSRPDGRWLPVDPIRAIVNKRKVFDPTPLSNAPGTKAATASSLITFPQAVRTSNVPKGFKEENRMLYVMAFEEDGHARDVTRRYAREYSAKIAKAQAGARQQWWHQVVDLVKRPYRLHRDDVEDEELAAAQLTEGMPTTIAGFKDHPLYFLERHLKQSEVIHPPPPETPELGKFRGESVYPRSCVLSLKTAETWMRTEGRVIMPGSQPLKTIKARAGTVNKQRELEVLRDELREAGTSEHDILQGLYARSQTEPYVPPPIVDGKIPKNNFGNIDLYVPSMLPKGAVHIPFKGITKVARKLGFDYAEAVTGFEFRKRRAHPVVSGVVVASENESALLEAYWETQKEEEEKARLKREEKALQHWVKLIHGLRVRRRLQEEYSDWTVPSGSTKTGNAVRAASSSAVQKTKGKGKQRNDAATGDATADGEAPSRGEEQGEEDPDHDAGQASGGGGFLAADDVVQPFHLPKYNPYHLLNSSSNPFARREEFQTHKSHSAVGGNDEGSGSAAAATDEKGSSSVRDGTVVDDDDDGPRPVIDFVTYDLDDEGDGDDFEANFGGQGSAVLEGQASGHPLESDFSAPLSLAELAAQSRGGHYHSDDGDSNEDGEWDVIAPRTKENTLTPTEEVAQGNANAHRRASRRSNSQRKVKLTLKLGESQQAIPNNSDGAQGSRPSIAAITGAAGAGAAASTAATGASNASGESGRRLRSGRSVMGVAGGGGVAATCGDQEAASQQISTRSNFAKRGDKAGAGTTNDGGDHDATVSRGASSGGKKRKLNGAGAAPRAKKAKVATAAFAAPKRNNRRGKKKKVAGYGPHDSESSGDAAESEHDSEVVGENHDRDAGVNGDLIDNDEDSGNTSRTLLMNPNISAQATSTSAPSPRKRSKATLARGGPDVSTNNASDVAATQCGPGGERRSLRARRSQTVAQLEEEKNAERA